MPAAVRLQNVVKLYDGEHGLGPVTADFRGPVTGIVGPNGAGKSTLIRLLLGLLSPTSGEVEVLGEVAGGEARRRIGYFPEGDAQFPDLTGIASVAYAGRLAGMPAAAAMQRAHQVLDYVELGEERYRYSANYSQGMRQRLKLAQVLVHDPDLLILDEPTEAVDPETRAHMLSLIQDLARAGIQVIVSTHLLADLQEIADEALVLQAGRVVAHGDMGSLVSAHAGAYEVLAGDDAPRLSEALAATGLATTTLGDRLVATTNNPTDVLRVAQDEDITIRGIRPMEQGLEAAVIELLEHPPSQSPAPVEGVHLGTAAGQELGGEEE